MVVMTTISLHVDTSGDNPVIVFKMTARELRSRERTCVYVDMEKIPVWIVSD